MTASELHTQIAAYVHDRLDEEEYRTRTHSLTKDANATGPAFTRDLAARLSLARTASAREPSEIAGALAPAAADAGASGPAGRTERPTGAAPQTPLDRFAGRAVSSGLVLTALVVGLVGLALVMRPADGAPAGMEIAAADSTAPVIMEVTQPRNLFNEAIANFELVASGRLGVQVPGDSRRAVEQHFASNGITHAVDFPAIPLPLVGGIVSRYGNRNVAQLVFSRGEQAVYLMEVPTEELQDGTSLYVTQDVLERLERGEKIIEQTPEGRSLVTYRVGDLVTVVVGNLDPESLQRMIARR